LRLRALRDSPDAFGSTFAREADRSDGDWTSRLVLGAASPRDLPLIAEWDREPVGLAWARIDELEPDAAHLYQMWVAPQQRGSGIGTALLAAAIEWARSAHARFVVLGVTCGNTSAVRLYSRAGFAPIGEPQPLRAGSRLLSQSMRLALQAGPLGAPA
jgi:ribosomal protein S18 acetylase RimI-like enzyme